MEVVAKGNFKKL